LSGVLLQVNGDGTQTRDFNYVDGVIDSYLYLADLLTERKLLTPLVVNVGNGDNLSVRALANKVLQITGSRSQIIYGPSRPGEVKAFHLRYTRLLSLGFEPKSYLEEGLEETMNHVRRHDL
jgi:UDP-glucuronate decarboxylase